MSKYITEKLAVEFNYTEAEKALLCKSKIQLNREEKKIFYQKINPYRRQYREFLMERYEQGTSSDRKEWFEITVESLLEKGGEADIADELVLDVVGRIDVYTELRERAQKEGKPIKALAGGGGCTFFLILFMVIVMGIIMIYSR